MSIRINELSHTYANQCDVSGDSPSPSPAPAPTPPTPITPTIPCGYCFGEATFTNITSSTPPSGITYVNLLPDAMSLSEQADLMLAWLKRDATSYFDTIQKNNDGNIECIIGDKVALLLGFDGTQKIVRIYLNQYSTSVASNYVASTTSYSSYGMFCCAYVTQYGIMIAWRENGSHPYARLWISKSINGTTSFVIHTQTSSTSDSGKFTAADFESTTSYYTYYSGAVGGTNTDKVFRFQTDHITSITPMAISYGDSYLPNLYMFRFCQSNGTPALSYGDYFYTMELAGIQYFTDSRLVLKV